MTVEVKKGSFEIKGAPIELLILRHMMVQPCLCKTNEVCSARAHVFTTIHDAIRYSSTINYEEIESELSRLHFNLNKPQDEQGEA